MTAPTPDVQDIASRAARVTSAEWGVVPLQEIVRLAADDIPALVTALAAVTAERDQAVEIIHDSERDMKALRQRIHELTTYRVDALENARASQQMHEDARRLLDQTLTERDKLREKLADAPHGFSCATIQWKTRGCTCWKAGL